MRTPKTTAKRSLNYIILNADELESTKTGFRRRLKSQLLFRHPPCVLLPKEHYCREIVFISQELLT